MLFVVVVGELLLLLGELLLLLVLLSKMLLLQLLQLASVGNLFCGGS